MIFCSLILGTALVFEVRAFDPEGLARVPPSARLASRRDVLLKVTGPRLLPPLVLVGLFASREIAFAAGYAAAAAAFDWSTSKSLQRRSPDPLGVTVRFHLSWRRSLVRITPS